MLRRTRFLIIAGIFILATVLAAVSVLGSLWVPWSLLPAGPARIAWSRLLTPTVLGTHLLPLSVVGATEHAWQAAYTREGTGETLVVLPELTSLGTTKKLLTADGWQVQRLGLYLYASRNGSPLSRERLLVAAKGLARTLLFSRWPAYPAALGSKQAEVAGITEPLMAVAARHGREVRVVVDTGSHISAPASGVGGQPQADAVVLKAPGELWVHGGKSFWDPAWRKIFGFRTTEPAIQETLSQFDLVAYLQEGDGAVLAATDPDAQFALTAATWVQDEDRRQRLVNRAFRLPDGTIGYERIPGEARPVFGDVDGAGCRGPLEERAATWICTAGERTAIGTSKDVALQGLAAVDGASVDVQLGRTILHELQTSCDNSGAQRGALSALVCQVSWVNWQVTGQHHIGVLELK